MEECDADQEVRCDHPPVIAEVHRGRRCCAAAGTGGVSLFNVRSAYSQNLPKPADVLAKINVGNMVKKEYREQYKLGDNDELWDPKKDWIRTVDWEAVRKEHAGKTVRFAIGAADRESAQEQIEPSPSSRA